MEQKIKARNSNKIFIESEDKMTVFLYQTCFGRIILKILVLPIISKISGVFLSSRFSKFLIKKFIYKNNVDMNDFVDESYKSFNDFFIRKIKKNKRKINEVDDHLISPCDAKLMAYKISNKNSFKIKNSVYKLNDLVPDIDINDFKNGYALVFRLCVDDYHRYSFIDDGKIICSGKINGKLHTVRPIAQEKVKIFMLNQREYTKILTKNFGDIIQVEVGALMVGKIVNHNKVNVKRGEEKGYFKFGASTIVLIINDVNIDDDILINSKNDIETIVKLGEKIGVKN